MFGIAFPDIDFYYVTAICSSLILVVKFPSQSFMNIGLVLYAKKKVKLEFIFHQG